MIKTTADAAIIRQRMEMAFKFAVEIKEAMKGKKGVAQEFTCPRCKQKVMAYINHRRHLRVQCSTPQCIQIIE